MERVKGMPVTPSERALPLCFVNIPLSFLCFLLCLFLLWRTGENGDGKPHYDGKAMGASRSIAGRGCGTGKKMCKALPLLRGCAL